jgi:MerR family transcriptional regulator, light-induced transcriptional regulator
MLDTHVHEQYLDSVLKGDRTKCRSIIEKILQSGIPTNIVYTDVIWPIMVEIEKLSRNDRITAPAEHLATRINRSIADQLQNKLPRRPVRNKNIAICCAEEELQELGAQISADLFESDGWQVKFLGGGLTNDDILSYVNEYGPDILLIYGTTPKQAPLVRKLIDTIKNVNAWPKMRIMVSGGIFNRADGLWEEIGADLFAANAFEAVQIASAEQLVQNKTRTINKRKRRFRKAEEISAIT